MREQLECMEMHVESSFVMVQEPDENLGVKVWTQSKMGAAIEYPMGTVVYRGIEANAVSPS